jgi:hypothetical protein
MYNGQIIFLTCGELDCHIQITSAKVKAMDSGGFIHIKGSNLLFLREPVRLGGLDPWVTKLQTDTELYIVSPTQTDVNIKGDDTENALTFIVLKTAFGAASHLLLEVSVVCKLHLFEMNFC